MEMIEKRVTDGSILRLIRKWIDVGVIDEGRLLLAEKGTGQGQVISPLLANVYLHYVLDEWFQDVVKPRLKGEAYEIRFADDFILPLRREEYVNANTPGSGRAIVRLPQQLCLFGRCNLPLGPGQFFRH